MRVEDALRMKGGKGESEKVRERERERNVRSSARTEEVKDSKNDERSCASSDLFLFSHMHVKVIDC